MRATCLALLLLIAFSLGAQELKIPEPAADRPIEFIENRGQVSDQYHQPRPDVRFYGVANGLQFHIRADGVSYQQTEVLSWRDDDALNKPYASDRKVPDSLKIHRTDINWTGTNSDFEVEYGSAFQQRYNFYQPVCPEGVVGVRAYDGVTFKNIYDGIDVQWYTNQGALEYDFIVHPGVDYTQIGWEITGAEELTISAAGELVIKTALGEIREQAPVAFQAENPVAVHWELRGNRVGFTVAVYDEELALTIDPLVRSWGTYYGDLQEDLALGVASDQDGNVYVVGRTNSVSNIATSAAHDHTYASADDGYIVKFDSAGNRKWATYYGGAGSDRINVVKVHAATHDIFVAGQTASTNSVATIGSYDDSFNGVSDGLLVRFDSAGVRQWGSYLGGNYSDGIRGIAFANTQDLFVVGDAISDSALAVNALHQPTKGGGTFDCFVSRFSMDGTTNHWTTYFGGSNMDVVATCVTDKYGNLYFGGWTTSDSAIATAGSHKGTVEMSDAFLAKFDPQGHQLWGTYFGGTGSEIGKAIAYDGDESIYYVGSTTSTQGIATTGAHQTSHTDNGVGHDGFLTRFSLHGDQVWGTYVGDSGPQFLMDCSVKNSLIYVAGINESPPSSLNSLVTPFAYQSTYAGGDEVFLARFNTVGNRHWGSFYGGTGNDEVNGLAVDHSGDILVVGNTQSTTEMGSTGSFKPTQSASLFKDAFLSKFSDSSFVINCNNFSAHIAGLIANNCNNDTSFVSVGTSAGIPPYSYLWDDGTATAQRAVTKTGLYTVTATDSSTCLSTVSVWVDHTENDTNHDVHLSPWGPFMPGFDNNIEVKVTTTSCGYHSDQVTLVLPPDVSYQSAVPVPDSILGDSLIWLYDSLHQSTPFIADLVVNTSVHAPLGEHVCFDLSIPVDSTESNFLDNDTYDCFPVVGSFDPNDILAQPPGACDSNYILPTDDLQYTIRFQNVGTAPAVFINIYDTLDSALDVSSIQLLNESHLPVLMEVIQGNVLHFEFDSIMLPDSMSNPVGSNGYVTFSIEFEPGTPMHTYIENKAAIYFDFNAPVITNTVHHTLVDSIPLIETQLTESACGSYDYQGQSLFASGLYEFDWQSADGCDSTVMLDLTIQQLGMSSLTAMFCDSFLVPSGTQFLTASGTYLDTLTSASTNGCDSVITINLTVHPPGFGSTSVTACNSITSPSGTQVWTTSGTYQDTLSTVNGCDSILTVQATILQGTTASIAPVVCNSYQSPGGQTLTTSGVYQDVLPNSVGCDSVITIDLTVDQDSYNPVNVISCGPYSAPNGQVYTSNGLYVDSLSSIYGCDSVVETNLSIVTIFTGVNLFGDSLAAASSGGGRTFQWLDCDNGFAPISGETNFYYTPSVTGNYALEITQFGCTDTSACQAVQVSPTGIFERKSSAALRVFPNPTSGLLQLQFEETQQEVEVAVYNPLGALILQKQSKLARNLELNISGAAGMYFLHVRTAGQTWEVLKVRKE